MRVHLSNSRPLLPPHDRPSLSLASLAKVDPNNLTIMLYADYGTQRPQDQSMAHLIVEQETNQLPNSQCTAAAASPPIEVFIPVDSMKSASTEKLLSSLDASKEVQRLQKQADKITREITALESRLTPAHMAKAPAAVTSQWTASLFEKREQLQAIQKNMEKYKKL